jgi:hypothetical protein
MIINAVSLEVRKARASLPAMFMGLSWVSLMAYPWIRSPLLTPSALPVTTRSPGLRPESDLHPAVNAATGAYHPVLRHALLADDEYAGDAGAVEHRCLRHGDHLLPARGEQHAGEGTALEVGRCDVQLDQIGVGHGIGGGGESRYLAGDDPIRAVHLHLYALARRQGPEHPFGHRGLHLQSGRVLHHQHRMAGRGDIAFHGKLLQPRH